MINYPSFFSISNSLSMAFPASFPSSSKVTNFLPMKHPEAYAADDSYVDLLEIPNPIIRGFRNCICLIRWK